MVELSNFLRIITAKNNEEKAFRQWLAVLPVMWSGAAKFIEFEDFRARLTGEDIDTRPESEILAEVEEIRREMKGDAAHGSI